MLIAQRAGQEFCRMENRAAHTGEQLLVTRNTTRYQRSWASYLVGLLHLSEQVVTDNHAEIVIVFLVTKATCHSATFDRGCHDIETNCAQQLNCWHRRVACSLLTM